MMSSFVVLIRHSSGSPYSSMGQPRVYPWLLFYCSVAQRAVHKECRLAAPTVEQLATGHPGNGLVASREVAIVLPSGAKASRLTSLRWSQKETALASAADCPPWVIETREHSPTASTTPSQ